MAVVDIDFEGTGTTTQTSEPDKTLDATKQVDGAKQEDVTSLNSKETDDITGKDGDKQGDKAADKVEGTDTPDTPSTGELTPGTQLEVDGETYTVADNGDVVDKDGKVVKQAADVKDWLSSFEQEADDALSINSIQESLGVDITDEEGNAIEFTNDAEGVKAYVKAVIDLKSRELEEGAINKLYADNPILKQFQDYVTVTGSPAGFGELPDRRNIKIEKDNETQQEAIIRMAAKEFNNAILNDNYIKYLKDTGTLYEEASAQLAALQQKDVAVRQEIEARAEEARQQEQQELTDYWNKINDVIKSGNIAGYKLPTSFVKEVNGKKQTLTPSDFFNYLSRHTEVDANGNKITAYQKDLANESEEDFMNRDLLTAWLMYTGGTYKDLVDMAIKEEQVRTLKLKSKTNAAKKTVRFIKPQGGKVSQDDILLS